MSCLFWLFGFRGFEHTAKISRFERAYKRKHDTCLSDYPSGERNFESEKIVPDTSGNRSNVYFFRQERRSSSSDFILLVK